jgi:hypothetical protein
MKTKMKVAIGILITIAFVGCATVDTRYVREEAKVSYMKDTGVFHIPVVADLDVSQAKITGTATGNTDNLQILRVRAVNNALSTNNADVLLEPRFTLEVTSRGTKVTVTGFPANYKNFRSITESDTQLLDNMYNIMRSSKYIEE